MMPAASTSALFSAIFAGPTGRATGFMIALVMPSEAAIARNALLMPCRFGRPKEMLEAPQVVFTPSSSRRRSVSSNCTTRASRLTRMVSP